MKLLLTSAIGCGSPGSPTSCLRCPTWSGSACAEKWAAGFGCPSYAIDDQTAIMVSDGCVEVISEGHWKFFAH